MTRLLRMPHLPPERLAALVDEPATADEQAHLASCAACLGELAAMRRLATAASNARDEVGPPLTTWAAVSAQLHAEGLMGGAARTASALRPPGAPPVWRRPVLQAAGLLLMLGGMAAGRWTAGASLLPGWTPRRTEMAAADTGAMPTFASRDEAAAALAQAEKTYKAAVAYVAAHDTTGALGAGDEDPVRTRLAALDDMVRTSRAALYAAPQDPVINQYDLATLGAREATLRQLGGVQTAAVRVAY